MFVRLRIDVNLILTVYIMQLYYLDIVKILYFKKENCSH